MTDHCPACGPGFLYWINADPLRQAAWLALPRRVLVAGEVLQAVGQPLGAVWFVEQGLLRSHFLNGDGRERTSAFHAEWQWAGMPPQQGAAAAATCAIDALERSRVVELGHAALQAWLQQQPALRATLTDALLANLLALSRRQSALMMDSAEQRYQQFLAEQPDIAERVALHQVASYLGITNVALSRVRRRMRGRQPAPAGAGTTPGHGPVKP
ncbi:MAG: Crp/Fnr family transcriptional regulator [Aquabacterium sp.]|nr:Crp/Fnr family transcriptional regulator [Aquabacterium sp.]